MLRSSIKGEESARTYLRALQRSVPSLSVSVVYIISASFAAIQIKNVLYKELKHFYDLY